MNMIQAQPAGGFVSAGGYDADTKKMRLEFKGGKTFEYDDVEPEKGNELLTVLPNESESAGKWFHANVKNAGYNTREV